MNGSQPAPKFVLYDFAFSHFNEKVRWALDWKGVDFRRESLLPGPHARRAKKLSGQSQTPILAIDDEIIAGSTQILRELEARVPARPLFPADPGERTEVDEWLEWLDRDLGPATRLAFFQMVFEDPAYAASIFTTGQPAYARIPYSWLFPRMIPMLRDKMSIDAASAARAEAEIHSALDRIASAVGATGYLVGGRFTAADLTAAALLLPLRFPAELPFALPEPCSPVVSRWVDRWRGDSGVQWMEAMFKEHRRP